jgi:hypothetical protein
MKSQVYLRIAKDPPSKREVLTLQNKYAKLRNIEILKSNSKLVSTITRIQSSKGVYNHERIDRQLFKPPKNNREFHDYQKQRQILEENEVR